MSKPVFADLTPANILAVDDTPANLQLLVGLLSAQGHKVRPVASGELALRAVQASFPDLILLDISMPGMDGYEVCRRLKADERTRDIPVIFISAHAESADKVRGFELGGVDYVAKPFQVDEVLARVAAHVTIRRQQLRLEMNFKQLRELERLRDSLTHMVVHDMRSPLLSLNLSLEYIATSIPRGDAGLDEMIATSRMSVQSLVEMASQMLDVSRIESGTMQLNLETVDLAKLAAGVVRGLQPVAGTRQISLLENGRVNVQVDRELIRRVLNTLAGNAIKFTPAGGTIAIAIVRNGDGARLEVADSGPGIDPAYHQTIFEKFGQVQSPEARKGYGLGLAFARMAVEAHGGKIGVVSALGQGSRFWFELSASS